MTGEASKHQGQPGPCSSPLHSPSLGGPTDKDSLDGEEEENTSSWKKKKREIKTG